MDEEPPSWRGARVVIKNKKAKLMLDNGDAIAKTVGKLHGSGYFDRNKLPKGDWVVAEVTARGSHLWDSHDMGPTPEEVSNQIYGPSGQINDENPLRLLVGYTAFTLKPVFATSYSLEEDGDEVDQTLSGFQLESGPGLRIPHTKVIPHHSILVCGNIMALASLLMHSDWEEGFKNGNLDVNEAKALVVQSCYTVHNGESPIVLADTQPPITSRVPNHKVPIPSERLIPDQPRGPSNPQLRQILPNAAEFLFCDSRSRGFVYKAPYMSNLTYPPQLYEELAKFGMERRYDKLNATAMLFAVQLWVDITAHPTKMREAFTTLEVPSVSLPVFLVYFEHWLKIHEYYRCLQYAHPFCLTHNMYIKDQCQNNYIFGIDEAAIDSEQVRSYVGMAMARYGAIPTGERVDLYPFMMSGTAMVHPKDIPQIPRLTPTQQALIGMPNLRVLGLPSYDRQKAHCRDIAMPADIAHLCFHNSQEYTYGRPYCLFDAPESFTTCQFSDSLESGTIWSHEFQKYAAPPDLPAEMVNTWTWRSNRRLEWLQKLGIMGRVRLRTGPDGLPYYHGMPCEDKDLTNETIASRVDRALQDPNNRL
ncbi:hypothetical protein IL306_001527 [Fusarium sp. DS 682]|nr:hypothetical protein IL306_001527 [Fusarium sp. DS 682]